MSDLASPAPHRPVGRALCNGLLGRCPRCAAGKLFDGYLTVNPACACCGEALHHHQADDAPPYFAIVVVGHVIVSLVLAVEIAYAPPLWLHAALWLPLTTALALAVLRPIKGAVIAYQWALRMHGFEADDGRAPAATGSR